MIPQQGPTIPRLYHEKKGIFNPGRIPHHPPRLSTIHPSRRFGVGLLEGNFYGYLVLMESLDLLGLRRVLRASARPLRG